MKALILATALAASPAMAQERCGPTEAVYSDLAQSYQERRMSTGDATNGAVLETWANTVTGTWTVFVTLPNGMSCAVASGTGFQVHEAEPNI